MLSWTKHSAVTSVSFGTNNVCSTITLIDGIVFARSVFHHSMNFRSAMFFGKGRMIENDNEKNIVFKALTEHIAKGRWNDARRPNQKETHSTIIAAIDIQTASAKIRTGPAKNDEVNYELSIWAGVLPVHSQTGLPVSDEKLPENITTPEYLRAYKR